MLLDYSNGSKGFRMAPDYDKKREARRLGYLGHIGADAEKGMLLMRCSINPLTDYYRHGNTGGGSATNLSQRASLPAQNNRQQVTRRFSQPRAQQQQQQQQQQQSPQQQSTIQSSNNQRQQNSPARIPLASIGIGVTVRNTDEQGSNSTQEVCDNSNDSGLGFDDRQQHIGNPSAWNNGAVGEEDTKRRKMDIKLESEDANFSFPERTGENHGKISTRSNSNGIVTTITSTRTSNGPIGRAGGVIRPRTTMGVYGKRPSTAHQGPVTLTSQLCSVSRDGKVQLQIICQPEQQHRARYQTEGSRGAVKDRTGNGFPIVRLIGYDKPATLQVFIGTDLGRVAPHMFYQACRVSGKNSTPCIERKIDGTIVIEVDMDPAKDMLVTCDCVGILKERNVDVEHRFPQEAGMLQGRSKKKSTKCRMVFRANITHDDGTSETLQVCSQPIVCTQPPGIPEISKKSLTACPCTGGLELFILGKNFLKDTRIVFQLDNEDLSCSLEPHWECSVTPDKEFLQQTHLVCIVPPYRRQDLNTTEKICVKLYAISSGKTSEPHMFFYTAVSTPPEPSVGKIESSSTTIVSSNSESSISTSPAPISSVTSTIAPISPVTGIPAAFLSPPSQPSADVGILKNDPSPPPTATTPQVNPIMMWASQATNGCSPTSDVMMPPPTLVSNPLLTRRSSSTHQLILPDNMKSEILDDTSENSMLSESSPASTTNGSSTSPLHQLVSENSREATGSTLLHPPPEVGLLGVVDLIHHQHPLTLTSQQQFPMHETSQVKVHINKDSSPILPPEPSAQTQNVVDLRMKQHEFDTINTFTSTPADQALPNPSGQSIEKYLNQIESTNKDPEPQEPTFVETMQQRASIIANARQQSEAATMLAAAVQSEAAAAATMLAVSQTAKLDELVNSVADSHQVVTPMQTTSPTSLLPEVEATRGSPPIPVKTMLLEALLPNASTPEPTPEETLLTTINALHPAMETPIVTAAGMTNSTMSVTSHNPLQVTSEPLPQIQALTPQEVVVQQQVEQVFAEAQKQVEEVVAQVQQQAAETVHEAQNQVVRQVVEYTQVVREAIKQVHAAREVQAVPHVQEVVKQATASVVKRAVKETTEGVVKQVQVVQKAIGHAQAAQVMKQAVQNDIGSMLNQPAGFVAEASSALASGAAQEPNQQRLTNAAEQAINNVISNATQDIINNRPITTTTAHAIIATKNIMNSVATQSAQLMNSAMEGILPQSPSNSGNIVEQVARKSPESLPSVAPTIQNNDNGIQVPVNGNNGQVNGSVKKPEDTGAMLPQELTSMSEHDLLSYINPSCFDQGTFLM